MENAYDTYSIMGSFFYKGLKYYNKGKFGKALINFKEALLINPNHSLTVKYIELCYAKFTDKEKAEEIAKCEQLAAQYLSEGQLDKVAQNRRLINLLNDEPRTREQYKAIFAVIVNEQARKFNTAVSNEVIISSTLTQKEIS